MKHVTAAAVIGLSLLCLDRLAAQIPGAPPRWSLGVKAGLNVADVVGEDATGSTRALRPVVGVFGVFRLYTADVINSHDDMFDLGLLTEVLRSEKGADWRRGSDRLALDSASGLRTEYVEVPALLLFNFAQREDAWINAYFAVGPHFAFLRRCRLNWAASQSGCAEANLSIRAFDWGAAAGGGVALIKGPLALTFDLRWASGDKLVSGKKLYNKTTTMLVGVRVQPPVAARATGAGLLTIFPRVAGDPASTCHR